MCVSPLNMTAPRPKSRGAWPAIVTAIAGFAGLTLLASIHEGLALLAALGLIGFAAISLFIAIVRKH